MKTECYQTWLNKDNWELTSLANGNTVVNKVNWQTDTVEESELGKATHTEISHFISINKITYVKMMKVYSIYPLFFAFFSRGVALLFWVFWAEDLLVPVVCSFYAKKREESTRADILD